MIGSLEMPPIQGGWIPLKMNSTLENKAFRVLICISALKSRWFKD